MPRCKKKRCCRKLHGERCLKPDHPHRREVEMVELYLDEFEAIRLCDFDGRSQIEASEEMGVSRGTVQRLLQSGRYKIVDALLHSKGIVIQDEKGETEDENLCTNDGSERITGASS